jgi:WD40 repeat protein
MILQGHVHQIQCLAAAPDKSFILTCDAGCDALLIQWDSKTGQVHIYPAIQLHMQKC